MKDARGHGSNPGTHAQGTTTVGHGFYARASAKGGRKIGEYGPHPDRATAANAAWADKPNARQVSTSRGPHGMDIQWHDKPMSDDNFVIKNPRSGGRYGEGEGF